MPSFRYVPPPAFLLVALTAFGLSGCAALNPLKGVEPGPDTAWSRPGRTVSPPARTARPAPPSNRSNSGRRADARTPEVASIELGGTVRAEAPVLAGPAALSVTLREEGEDWIGTPYRYGGTSRRGIDCSAFVQTLMEESLGLSLPRTTATQVQEGEAIDRDDLLPGDLVFFRRRGTRHVGVYLGEGEFIHASSSRGVIVSRLDEGYYQRHYWTARRVLDDPHRFLAEGATPPIRRAADRPAPPRPERRADGESRSAW